MDTSSKGVGSAGPQAAATTTAPVSPLLRLPAEVLIEALLHAPLHGVHSFACTCKLAYTLVYPQSSLSKSWSMQDGTSSSGATSVVTHVDDAAAHGPAAEDEGAGSYFWRELYTRDYDYAPTKRGSAPQPPTVEPAVVHFTPAADVYWQQVIADDISSEGNSEFSDLGGQIRGDGDGEMMGSIEELAAGASWDPTKLRELPERDASASSPVPAEASVAALTASSDVPPLPRSWQQRAQRRDHALRYVLHKSAPNVDREAHFQEQADWIREYRRLPPAYPDMPKITHPLLSDEEDGPADGKEAHPDTSGETARETHAEGSSNGKRRAPKKPRHDALKVMRMKQTDKRTLTVDELESAQGTLQEILDVLLDRAPLPPSSALPWSREAHTGKLEGRKRDARSRNADAVRAAFHDEDVPRMPPCMPAEGCHAKLHSDNPLVGRPPRTNLDAPEGEGRNDWPYAAMLRVDVMHDAAFASLIYPRPDLVAWQQARFDLVPLQVPDEEAQTTAVRRVSEPSTSKQPQSNTEGATSVQSRDTPRENSSRKRARSDAEPLSASPNSAPRKKAGASGLRRSARSLMAKIHPSLKEIVQATEEAAAEAASKGDGPSEDLTSIKTRLDSLVRERPPPSELAARIHVMHGPRYFHDARYLGHTHKLPPPGSTPALESLEYFDEDEVGDDVLRELFDEAPRVAYHRPTHGETRASFFHRPGMTARLTHAGTRQSDAELRAVAREWVYDGGRLGWSNAWGPFKAFRVDMPSLVSRPDHFDHTDPLRARYFAAGDGQDTAIDVDAMPDPSPSDGSTPTGDDPEVIDLTDPVTIPTQYADLPIVIDDVDVPAAGPTAGSLDQAPPPADAPITPITIGEIIASFDDATDDEFDDADFVANPLAGLEDEEMDDASDDESDSDDDDAFFHHIELLRLRSYFGALPRAQARSIMRSLEKDELTTIITRVEPDWRMLEAIQIVVHSNLLPLRHHDRWGKLFHVPRKPEESFRDYRERRALELTIPSGWDMSRGQEMDLNNLQPAVTNGWQPHDWARVEGSWIGTYFFLNYSCFLSHNIRKAEMMEKNGVHSIDPENYDRFDVDKERPPSLLQHEEAVGDLLQFKAKIIDPEVGRKQYSHGPGEAEEDPRYPTLYFRGTHMAYEEDAEPLARSTCHGWVRPVFDGGVTPETRQICGLQWRIISAYAGGDRWSMSGFQCGQPGTRAPILGTWTDANHDANSPSGPFCFWRVGDDTWAQRDEAVQEEHDSV